MKTIILSILLAGFMFFIASAGKIQIFPGFKISIPYWDRGIAVVLAYMAIMYAYNVNLRIERIDALNKAKTVLQLEFISAEADIVKQWKQRNDDLIIKLKKTVENNPEVDEFDRGFLRALLLYEKDLDETYIKVNEELLEKVEKINTKN